MKKIIIIFSLIIMGCNNSDKTTESEKVNANLKNISSALIKGI